MDVTPDGIWIGEQVTDRVILTDMTGKVLKAFQTECHNCSGLAVGGGYFWLSANGAPQFDRPIRIDNTSPEILQCRMDGTVVKRHAGGFSGGGATGVEYVDGTLWMVASRLRALMQVKSRRFSLSSRIRFKCSARTASRGTTARCGSSTEPTSLASSRSARRAAPRWRSSSSPPAIPIPWPWHNKREAIFCDAGIHPGWDRDKSPHTGWLCRVDVV